MNFLKTKELHSTEFSVCYQTFLFCFEIRFLCLALAALELLIKIISCSEIHLLLGTGIKSVHHYTWLVIQLLNETFISLLEKGVRYTDMQKG